MSKDRWPKIAWSYKPTMWKVRGKPRRYWKEDCEVVTGINYILTDSLTLSPHGAGYSLRS
jgi:hypothetical protein